MTNSFFVSSELKNRLSPETLVEASRETPYMIIGETKYDVIGAEYEGAYIKIKIVIDKSFKIKKIINISESNIFGVRLNNIKCHFRTVHYDINQKNYICVISIDEEKFWS